MRDAVDRQSDHLAGGEAPDRTSAEHDAMPTSSSPIYSSAEECHCFVWRLNTDAREGYAGLAGCAEGLVGERVAGS